MTHTPFALTTPLLLLLLQSLASATKQPNIVFILSDDQDLLLGSLNFMPSIQKYLLQQGTSLSNHFTSTPVCCPSRSSIITGRFPHNYPQIHPTQKTSCLDPSHDKLSVFSKLHNAGYRVGLFGKHMNAEGMAPFCPTNKHSQGRMPKGEFLLFSVFFVTIRTYCLTTNTFLLLYIILLFTIAF